MGKNLDLFGQKISQVERAKEILCVYKNAKTEIQLGIILFEEMKKLIEAKAEERGNRELSSSQVKIVLWSVVCSLIIQYVSFWPPEGRRMFSDLANVFKDKVKMKMEDRTKKAEEEIKKV